VKVLSVVGARPQFIKAAPLSRALRQRHDEILVHTGQHHDAGMSQVFFDELGIPAPDHNLGVHGGSHGEQTARMLLALEPVVQAEAPDAVLVYGDTNSTLAGALVAAKLDLPLGHVEAGLRSFDRSMPEEVNRVVADHLASGLYCPHEEAAAQLAKEGITRGVFVVGDLMVDQFQATQATARKDQALLKQHGLEPGGYWLMTLHRPANTDEPERLARILQAVGDLGVPVLFAMHPRTRQAVTRHGLGALLDPLILSEPLPYLATQSALLHSAGLLTDSGGMQKEAYLAGVPCVTLRDRTEWTQTVRAGWNHLVDADPAAIARAVKAGRPKGPRKPLWGKGDAATRITEAIGSLCVS
jgi:UDP-GlcNAc3NAcA epimerase